MRRWYGRLYPIWRTGLFKRGQERGRASAGVFKDVMELVHFALLES
ncbi:hypothetical protein [Brevibacillus sp. SIMBA_040]